MPHQAETDPNARAAGDRRQVDRRRGDRRAPPPPWLRPWAFVLYGVGGSLLLVLGLSSLRGDPEPSAGLRVTTATAPPSAAPGSVPPASGPARDAYSVGDFERLVAEGGAASHRRIRTVLLCSSIGRVALHETDGIDRAIADLADDEGHVPGAECEWGPEVNAPDFLLLVPPALATRFAEAPEVTRGFVTRRRVPAEVLWLGREDALALRTAGVLRRILPQGPAAAD